MDIVDDKRWKMKRKRLVHNGIEMNQKETKNDTNNLLTRRLKEMHLLKLGWSARRGGGVKVSAIFGSVNWLFSLRRSDKFEHFKNHSFIYMLETMVTRYKFENIYDGSKKNLRWYMQVKN